MKIFLRLVQSAAVLFALAACDRCDKVGGDPLNTRIYTLDNGLQLYMSVNREEPRIQTFIAVKVGSKNDPSETTGLAHYFEHLMFKGSENFGTTDYAAEKPFLDNIEELFETYRKTSGDAARKAIYHQIDSISYEASKYAIPNEYDKLMAMIGADGSNAWTSEDETVYVEDIPSNQIDNWARIQADRFRHNVIRGFHTELETIYEEKNMYMNMDSDKVWEAMSASLFPNHPYGRQTTIGTQEHLKNPSITNVKEYYRTYYVPNNIRICVSGDFNPKGMIAAVEKYFGDWEPNPNIPALRFEPEKEITEPVVKDVWGNESESIFIGWRLPACNDIRTYAIAGITGEILSNSQAGLIDIDILQQQKALSMGAFYMPQADYSGFIVSAAPKQGQSLDELKEIALAEIGKLRAGDFDEALIAATVNNLKLARMRQLESNRERANLYVDAFINNFDWKEFSHISDHYAAVRKKDIVEFANRYLKDNSYAVVNKRQGEDRTAQKISAPEITPIVTNRDFQSDFFTEIQSTEIKPIKPVFVNFAKDMSQFRLSDGVNVLYKRNDTNDIFRLEMVWNTGREENPALAIACDYLGYLGTPDMTAGRIASRMYGLACSYSIGCAANTTTLRINGLAENMPEAVRTIESLIAGAQPDDRILDEVKADILKYRINSKMNQRSCAAALKNYVINGPEYISRTTLDNGTIEAMTSEELLAMLRDVFSKGHELRYYGPLKESELKSCLKSCHSFDEDAEAMPEVHTKSQLTGSDRVILADFDAKQVSYLGYSDRGEVFDPGNAAGCSLFNEYFNGGMNGIVFQEMREARGLAYSASASLWGPSSKDDTYAFVASIGTQADKVRTACEAFDEIINGMPESQAAFDIAKEALINRLRTSRTTGFNVLSSYTHCRSLGISEPTAREIFEKVQGMTLDDVVAFQHKWIKGRNYTHAILGRVDDLDMEYLGTLGPVETVTMEQIFGY